MTDPRSSALLDSIRLRAAAVTNGASPSDARDPIGLGAALADPANLWLQSLFNPDTLPLSPRTRNMVNDEVTKVTALTRADFRQMQQKALAFAAGFADRVGLGSATYNRTMGFSTAAPKRATADDDYSICAALNDVAAQFGVVAAFGQDFTARVPTTIEYVAGIANDAGIAMRVPRSKFAVPFPYGGTLERLAEQQLGDSTRWFEIAALNDLRAPYVDETGTVCTLLVNGEGNDVVVADASRLVLGQAVVLSGTTVLKSTRVVLAAQKVGPGYWVVTLNGSPDLGRYTVGQSSTLQFYDIHTVHGGQVLYVPSDLAPNLSSPYVPTAEDLTRLLQVGNIDGLLTEQGDVAIQPDGEWPFVFGLAGLIQWARTAVTTPRGSMVLHPEWGLPLEVGQSLADMSAADALASLRTMFRSGPSFTGIKSASVEVAGPVAKVSFEAGIRGVDALVPITFQVPR